MPSKGHKRKRSLQEDPVDLTKMRAAMDRLNVLKEELSGIEETELEMGQVMSHVSKLEEILSSAKKTRISFSAISKGDLNRLGVLRQRLVLDHKKIASAVASLPEQAVEEIQHMRGRILDIYNYVNMDFEPGARMILDAVLLTLAKIAAQANPKVDVAILPEMRIASGDGIQVVNDLSKYEIWLTGNVDYAVLQYLDELDNKDRLLGIDSSRDDALKVAMGRLFLVEAKRLDGDSSLASHMPEAVSQSIAVGKLTNQKEVRFCLSNGKSWIFSVLKDVANEDEKDRWIYYESAAWNITRESVEQSDMTLRKIIHLVFEWLMPKDNSLYQLLG